MYKIILSDNTEISNLQGDYDDLISPVVLTTEMFSNKMSPLTIIDLDSENLNSMTWDHAKIIDLHESDDGWHIRFDAYTEIDALIDHLMQENTDLREQNEMLTECVLEMSEIVYGGEL